MVTYCAEVRSFRDACALSKVVTSFAGRAAITRNLFDLACISRTHARFSTRPAPCDIQADLESNAGRPVLTRARAADSVATARPMRRSVRGDVLHLDRADTTTGEQASPFASTLRDVPTASRIIHATPDATADHAARMGPARSGACRMPGEIS